MSDFYINAGGRLCYKCMQESGIAVLRPVIALYAYEIAGIQFQIVMDDREQGKEFVDE